MLSSAVDEIMPQPASLRHSAAPARAIEAEDACLHLEERSHTPQVRRHRWLHLRQWQLPRRHFVVLSFLWLATNIITATTTATTTTLPPDIAATTGKPALLWSGGDKANLLTPASDIPVTLANHLHHDHKQTSGLADIPTEHRNKLTSVVRQLSAVGPINVVPGENLALTGSPTAATKANVTAMQPPQQRSSHCQQQKQPVEKQRQAANQQQSIYYYKQQQNQADGHREGEQQQKQIEKQYEQKQQLKQQHQETFQQKLQLHQQYEQQQQIYQQQQTYHQQQQLHQHLHPIDSAAAPLQQTAKEAIPFPWTRRVKRILKNKHGGGHKATLLGNATAASHNLKVNQVFEAQQRMSPQQIVQNRGRIVLLGLFELTSKQGMRPDGWSELSAAIMAVDDINRKQLLPGYTLELVTNDTQCDPGVGVDRFFHAIYTQPATRMVMLLGSACSEVTESLAKVVPYWNIVQVSFGSTSPALSDRKEFPYFYRTVAPDSSHNPARIAFIRRFGWDTVTTFSQNEEVHSLAVNDLVTELEAANISCAATITFAATDFKEQLLLLRETDTRIIIGSFSQDLAPQILCEAYRLRMFGADYAWILHESMGAPWWNLQAPHNHHPPANQRASNSTPSYAAASSVATAGPTPIHPGAPATSTSTMGMRHLEGHSYCTALELQEAVENLIIVSSHNSIVGDNISISGLNNDMFNRELQKKYAKFNSLSRGERQPKPQPQPQRHNLKGPAPESARHFADSNDPAHVISRYAPQTYDAVWAIALALRAADQRWHKEAMPAELDRFDYTRSDMAWEFLQQMGKLDFLGVSGPVSFSGPDRVGTTAFYQIQKGQLEPIALYYPAADALDFECPKCKRVKWHGGEVPIARRVFKLRVATIAPLAFYTIAMLSSVGVALALAFLAFNLHFRKLKAIKLSSPKLSNITAVGCILVYAAVILLGLDYSTLPSSANSFAHVCTARVYLLSAGFSLAFGSMFAKTYRVHRIFTRTGSVFKDRMLQDIQLILLVCGLLLVDGLVVTLWVVADPMERHLHNLTLEISSVDRSVVYQPQVEVCRSQHTQSWLGVLYAYKGLLLIVGVYMAWETRHVKIPALNDSQYIGVSVYSVVITSGIVVVLANLISERVTLAFITITALILTSTTATLCLLFIPKLHDIWARNDIIDPVIHSMGLKMECNTRRFVIDDRRELQYRVEVQNRVYKKEIASLDAEIKKLERMLESGTASTATSSSTSLIHKPEVTVTSDTSGHLPPPQHNPKSRTPSISGILPNLLLSVLPPVIPRASWPSAEYMQIPMRRSVTFASQPQLEDNTIAGVCLPAHDLYNLRLAHQHATETKTGFINRLKGIFSRTTSSNKDSTASLADQKGLKAAFRSHMGLFTRLIPSSQTASCNAIYSSAGPKDDPNADLEAGPSRAFAKAGGGGNNLRPMHRLSFAKSGTHLDATQYDPTLFLIPTISTTVDSAEDNSGQARGEELTNPAGSVGRYVKVHETKVNFQLPSNRRPSILQQMQPAIRVRGSPRFPHRILPPTCSLTALEESDDRASTSPKARLSWHQTSGSGHWKSLEVSPKSKLSLNDSTEEDEVPANGAKGEEVDADQKEEEEKDEKENEEEEEKKDEPVKETQLSD